MDEKASLAYLHVKWNFDLQSPRSSQSLLRKKFNVIETTDINNGLEDLQSGTAALLSDYVTVYPIIKHSKCKNIILNIIIIIIITFLCVPAEGQGSRPK